MKNQKKILKNIYIRNYTIQEEKNKSNEETIKLNINIKLRNQPSSIF